MNLLEKLNKPIIRRSIILTTTLSCLLYTENNILSKEEGIYKVTIKEDELVVEGENGEEDWLTCTLYNDSNKQERTIDHLSNEGRFEIPYNTYVNDTPAVSYDIRLWDKLVWGIDCVRNKDGEGCGECDKYGYHLEGQKDVELGLIRRDR